MSKEKVIVPPMFEEVKEAIAAYNAEALLIEQEEMRLHEEMDSMTSELAEKTVAAEGASVDERVSLMIRTEELSTRGQVLRKVLDELQDKKSALKLKYALIYRKALSHAGEVRQQFNGNGIVGKHLYAMLEEITGISQQMGKQYQEVASDLDHIFRDEKVVEQYRNFKYHYTRDSYRPEFWHTSNTVLHKQDVLLAVSGNISESIEIKKPKEVVSHE